MFLMHGQGTCSSTPCPDEYNTMPIGIALAGVAGAAAITSTVLFLMNDDAEGSYAQAGELKSAVVNVPQRTGEPAIAMEASA